MKLKRNKLFLLVGSLGIITSSCLIITSCGKNENQYDDYDFNTSIDLGSKKRANQLYDVAKTKIPQFNNQTISDHGSIKRYIENQFKESSDLSKTIFYWEVALNLSKIGKNHDYKKNGNLSFNISTHDWFSLGGEGEKWCSVIGIKFNYDESKDAMDIATSEEFDVDYNNGDQHWSIRDSNSVNLFASWALWSMPTPEY